jgi:hypothetical protein
MAKPLLGVKSIYNAALDILDEQGPHPNFSRLMTVANREAITIYVNQLLRILLHHGFTAQLPGIGPYGYQPGDGRYRYSDNNGATQAASTTGNPV